MAVLIHDGFLLPSHDAASFLSNLQLVTLVFLFIAIIALYFRRSSDTGRVRL